MVRKMVSRRRQGALVSYRYCSSELSGGSGGCGRERRRRPGSRAGKPGALVDAQGRGGHARLNQKQRGGRSLPESPAGVAQYIGGVSKIVGSLVVEMVCRVRGNERRGEGVK